MSDLLVKINDIPKEIEGVFLFTFSGKRWYEELRDELASKKIHKTRTIPGTRKHLEKMFTVIDEPDIHFPHGLEGFVTMYRSHDTLFIRGRIISEVRRNCSRCTKQVSSVFDIPYNYVCLLQTISENEIELKEEDLDLSFLTGTDIDIGQIIIEQIVLTLPIQPLCSEECRGLCATCGKDLNTGTCRCHESSTDSRWEKLKNFQIRKEG
jgi:uncharacterized protein